MSKETYFRQCKLEKPIKDGTKHQTTWIPEKYAVKDKYLEVKMGPDEWQNGWRVSSVGSERLQESYLKERASDYRNTRSASDI